MESAELILAENVSKPEVFAYEIPFARHGTAVTHVSDVVLNWTNQLKRIPDRKCRFYV